MIPRRTTAVAEAMLRRREFEYPGQPSKATAQERPAVMV